MSAAPPKAPTHSQPPARFGSTHRCWLDLSLHDRSRNRTWPLEPQPPSRRPYGRQRWLPGPSCAPRQPHTLARNPRGPQQARQLQSSSPTDCLTRRDIATATQVRGNVIWRRDGELAGLQPRRRRARPELKLRGGLTGESAEGIEETIERSAPETCQGSNRQDEQCHANKQGRHGEDRQSFVQAESARLAAIVSHPA